MDASADFSWTVWNADWSVVIGLLILGGAYLYGAGPLRERFGWAEYVEPGKVAAFFGGLLVIFLALVGPLHELAENYFFTAHMTQHLLLQLAMPPLLILGTPNWLLRPLLRSPRVVRMGRLLVHPVTAFALFNAVLVGWHLPPLYDLALKHHNLHIAQHFIFMVTAVIAWWPLLSPLPELPRPHPSVQMVYLFAQSVPMGFLGAIITFAGEPTYTFYAEAPRLWGISALVDQQLGGVLMKSAAGVVFLVALSVVFFTWFAREEREAKA